MTLREKQSRFAVCVGQLIARATASGFDLTFGEAYRTPEQAIVNHLGIAGREQLADLVEADGYDDLAAALRGSRADGIVLSVHRERLAVDFNLFRAGELLTAPADFEPLGRFWESLDPDASWGGSFGDYGHFSFRHNGRR